MPSTLAYMNFLLLKKALIFFKQVNEGKLMLMDLFSLALKNYIEI